MLQRNTASSLLRARVALCSLPQPPQASLEIRRNQFGVGLLEQVRVEPRDRLGALLNDVVFVPDLVDSEDEAGLLARLVDVATDDLAALALSGPRRVVARRGRYRLVA